MFIGRERELSSLEKLYRSDKFEFAVVYGRRRVGKTALLSHFIKDKNSIYFMGIESNAKQKDRKGRSRQELRNPGSEACWSTGAGHRPCEGTRGGACQCRHHGPGKGDRPDERIPAAQGGGEAGRGGSQPDVHL